PYDNAVAESTYRAFKIEFVYQETFQSLEELALKTEKATLYKCCTEKCCLFSLKS
ncbi:IS3 family transposase, partial [Streptococcus agalactiae]|nr:IS3 family transposase [Streptococcus agalactiae]